MHPTYVAISIQLALLAAHAAQAQETPDSSGLQALDTITVIGTRSENSISDVPASVSVIDRKRMDREQSRTLKDLLRYEPGVSVSNAYGRFGIGDVRIRGLGGNRVQMQIDGVDVADNFSIGSFSNAGRNFVDPELLERVEILRGAASALYGSDALGGVLQFRTRDPNSYVNANESWGLRSSIDNSSEDSAVGTSALLASVGEHWSAMLQLNRREGSEAENRGSVDTQDRTRTKANPTESARQNVLAKLMRNFGAGHQLRFVVDASDSRNETQVLSSQGAQTVFGQTVLTSSLDADDSQKRRRFSFSMQGDNVYWALANYYEFQLYQQNSETLQKTREERATIVSGAAVNPARRERDFNFDQDIVGAEALFRKEWEIGSSEHTFSYGLSLKNTRIDERRDGRSINLITGAISGTIFPDVFPVRDFPVSDTREIGVFIQDEMRFFGSRLGITTALRWDSYKLTPKPDAIFAADNPGIVPVSISTTNLSPKLSLSWKLQDNWSIYVSGSEGFRAPPYSDANLGFTNFASGYTAIPNPDLKPETSRGLEIGSKASGRYGSIALAAYENNYDDFIESLRAIGVDPNSGLLVFQSQNIAQVKISGFEFQGRFDFEAINLPGWLARFSYATARGDDKTANRPLNSIDPVRAVLGIGYEQEKWSLELVGNFAKRKTRISALDASGTPAFLPPGYGVLDLLGQYHLSDKARIDIAVLNLGDKRYWDWADVPGVAASSSLLDRYTRPGRGFRLALNYRF
jgi:hemoglobin/transferrin/lactoferrin receptor protein